MGTAIVWTTVRVVYNVYGLFNYYINMYIHSFVY